MKSDTANNQPRKRLLWGFALVFVPLAVLMLLQYRWLSQLQTNSEIARRAMLDQIAGVLAKKIKINYWEKAAKYLDVNPELIESECDHIFEKVEKEEIKGITAIFGATINEKGPPSGTIFWPDTGLREQRTFKVDVMYWKMLIMANLEGEGSRFVIDDRNPESPMILQPIYRGGEPAWKNLVGVAGMVPDPEFFKYKVLPYEIENLLLDTPDANQLTVEIRDSRGDIMLRTGSRENVKDQAWRQMSFPFNKWQIMLGTTDQSAAQWARTNFLVNMSLSALLAVVLLIGLGVALRTVAREMRLSQMKSDFVSNVSHELRTPLSSVRAFGELLRRGKAPNSDKVREYGAYIETESRRLGRLIDNILDFSKIESGQKVYNMDTGDIHEVFIKTVKIFEVRLSRRDLHVNLDVREPLPERMRFDADAISQALSNLLDNAVKYSIDGNQIDVSLRQEGNRVMIAVRDQGIGIPEADQDQIFDRFHRVSTGLVHDVKGSGLGLSIVQHIIQAHRGEITVESQLGEGSTFTLILPITQTAAGSASAQMNPVNPATPAT